MAQELKVTEEEWRRIGEEKLKLSDQLLHEIIFGTGEGDHLVQVRKSSGVIVIKTQPWFK